MKRKHIVIRGVAGYIAHEWNNHVLHRLNDELEHGGPISYIPRIQKGFIRRCIVQWDSTGKELLELILKKLHNGTIANVKMCSLDSNHESFKLLSYIKKFSNTNKDSVLTKILHRRLPIYIVSWKVISHLLRKNDIDSLKWIFNQVTESTIFKVVLNPICTIIKKECIPSRTCISSCVGSSRRFYRLTSYGPILKMSIDAQYHIVLSNMIINGSSNNIEHVLRYYTSFQLTECCNIFIPYLVMSCSSDVIHALIDSGWCPSGRIIFNKSLKCSGGVFSRIITYYDADDVHTYCDDNSIVTSLIKYNDAFKLSTLIKSGWIPNGLNNLRTAFKYDNNMILGLLLEYYSLDHIMDYCNSKRVGNTKQVGISTEDIFLRALYYPIGTFSNLIRYYDSDQINLYCNKHCIDFIDTIGPNKVQILLINGWIPTSIRMLHILLDTLTFELLELLLGYYSCVQITEYCNSNSFDCKRREILYLIELGLWVPSIKKIIYFISRGMTCIPKSNKRTEEMICTKMLDYFDQLVDYIETEQYSERINTKIICYLIENNWAPKSTRSLIAVLNSAIDYYSFYHMIKNINNCNNCCSAHILLLVSNTSVHKLKSIQTLIPLGINILKSIHNNVNNFRRLVTDEVFESFINSNSYTYGDSIKCVENICKLLLKFAIHPDYIKIIGMIYKVNCTKLMNWANVTSRELCTIEDTIDTLGYWRPWRSTEYHNSIQCGLRTLVILAKSSY